MLNENIIGRIKIALEEAPVSEHSELKDRLNICNMLLGTYNPIDNDFIQFKNAEPEIFESFYNKFFYRKDGRFPLGSGIVFTLIKIMDKLDDIRSTLKIDQKELDNIKNEIVVKQKEIESFGTYKAKILESKAELSSLKEQKDKLDKEAQEWLSLRNDVDKLNDIVSKIQNDMTAERRAELEKTASELKEKLNSNMDMETVEEIIRQCSGFSVFSKVDLDIFCEYIQDEQILKRLKEAGLIEEKILGEIERYEGQLNVIFKEYRECLCTIIKAIKPDTIGK